MTNVKIVELSWISKWVKWKAKFRQQRCRCPGAWKLGLTSKSSARERHALIFKKLQNVFREFLLMTTQWNFAERNSWNRFQNMWELNGCIENWKHRALAWQKIHFHNSSVFKLTWFFNPGLDTRNVSLNSNTIIYLKLVIYGGFLLTDCVPSMSKNKKQALKITQKFL